MVKIITFSEKKKKKTEEEEEVKVERVSIY